MGHPPIPGGASTPVTHRRRRALGSPRKPALATAAGAARIPDDDLRNTRRIGCVNHADEYSTEQSKDAIVLEPIFTFRYARNEVRREKCVALIPFSSSRAGPARCRLRGTNENARLRGHLRILAEWTGLAYMLQAAARQAWRALLAPPARSAGTSLHSQSANARLRGHLRILAEWTGLEPATPGVTGRYSNQLNYHSLLCCLFDCLAPKRAKRVRRKQALCVNARCVSIVAAATKPRPGRPRRRRPGQPGSRPAGA